MNPTTIAQSVLASQSDDSNDSVTKEIDLNTSASNYAAIVPIVPNAWGFTSTNPSTEQTLDNYSDIEIDDIDDTDYVPPEEFEGISVEFKPQITLDNLWVLRQLYLFG